MLATSHTLPYTYSMGDQQANEQRNKQGGMLDRFRFAPRPVAVVRQLTQPLQDKYNIPPHPFQSKN